MDYKKFLKQGNTMFLPNLSIDTVIIGNDKNVLKCLLLKMGNKWMLPGGYIKNDEDVDEAASNILKQRTGLKDPYLKFLAVFGDKNRQFKKLWQEFISDVNLEWEDDSWLNKRFVTLVYYSLVNIGDTHPTVGFFDETFGWFDFDDLPAMWMDHKSIALTAREKLKEDVQHDYNVYNLLPEVFTMPMLYQLHQNILGEEIDRSRFQKKMLASGLFERLPKVKKNTPGSNPFQYRVKKSL
ncbi:NUDIX domain-containing protein [uncultured Draconibacterium sp.]|uniref:NUDIX hydrolase n=1 Tax=uncultured Draconibacterium sp. TaxID=1573823 RepID=UPI0029C6E95D|nr:NUDIX domain-containing protein [uncultured Draconibacterium sp.]